MKILAVSLGIVLLVAGCETQDDNPSTFEKSEGYGRRDVATALAGTPGDGYLIAGYTESIRNNQDVYLMKIGADAGLQWARTFGTSGADWAYATAQLQNGTYVAGGSVWRGVRGYDFYVIGLNPQGQLLWTHAFGENGNDEIRGASPCSDGGCILIGTISIRRIDPVVMKLGATGEIEWMRPTGDTNYADYGTAIRPSRTGGYVAAGFSALPGVQERTHLMRLDDTGAVVWRIHYGGQRNRNNCLVETEDGSLIAAGRAYQGLGKWSAWSVRADADGVVLWERSYFFPGSGYDEIYAAVESDDGTIVVTGTTYVEGLGFQLLLMEIGEGGEVLWSRKYGGTGNETGSAIQKNSTGYMVAGSTTTASRGAEDVYILKTDKDGHIAE